MFDTLGDIWNQQQQGLAQQGLRPGQMDTAGIAGKLISIGVLPQDAYVKAAEIFRGQEQNNINRMKQDAEQMQKHQYSQLADYIRSNPEATNQELTAYALSNGVNPANIGQLINAVGVQEKIVNDPLYGAQIYTNRGGVYEPKNGNSINARTNVAPTNAPTNTSNVATNEAPPLNRVEAKEKYKSDLREKEFQNKEYEKIRQESVKSYKSAKSSNDTLKLLEKAYEGFDKDVPSYLKSGSFLANTEELPSLNKGQTRALLYNEKNVEDLGKIKKLTGELYRNTMGTLYAKEAGNVFMEKMMLDLQPDSGVAAGARKDIINNLKEINAKSELHHLILNKRIEGIAPEILVNYIKDKNDGKLVDRKGRLDKEIIKNIPQYAQQMQIEDESPEMGIETSSNTPTKENPFMQMMQERGLL